MALTGIHCMVCEKSMLEQHTTCPNCGTFFQDSQDFEMRSEEMTILNRVYGKMLIAFRLRDLFNPKAWIALFKFRKHLLEIHQKVAGYQLQIEEARVNLA